jgi:hypothetical protein
MSQSRRSQSLRASALFPMHLKHQIPTLGSLSVPRSGTLCGFLWTKSRACPLVPWLPYRAFLKSSLESCYQPLTDHTAQPSLWSPSMLGSLPQLCSHSQISWIRPGCVEGHRERLFDLSSTGMVPLRSSQICQTVSKMPDRRGGLCNFPGLPCSYALGLHKGIFLQRSLIQQLVFEQISLI